MNKSFHTVATWLAVAVASTGLTVCAVAQPIDPKNPPEGRFSDEWAEIYLGGGKVGFAHSSFTRRGDRIQTELRFRMVLGRAEQPVKIDLRQESVETLAGVPISFASETDMSVMTSTTRGTIANGRVKIITSQFGMEQTQEFDFPTGALMTWGTFREGLLRGFKPGTEYSFPIYAPELRLDGAVTSRTIIGDWEEFSHRGQSIRGQRVVVTLESPVGSMEMVSWVNADGLPLKAKLPMPGMGDMLLITTDQATALSDFVPPEFFMTSVIKAGRKIDPASAKRIRYRIRAKNDKTKLSDLPDTGAQRVLAEKDGIVELEVSRQNHFIKCKIGRKDLSAKNLTEYLGSNLMINTADPKLIELAKKAAAGETKAFALADNLRRFVTDYVATKSLNIGFATASEVARTREGDCSEHGLLLAALGRISGLPSRVVVGLAYVSSFGGREDIFGYHLWTQFYIDGRWVDFDAALGESDCSPIRIAFAVSSLKNSGLADLSLPLLSKIGAIDIDILEIE